jgi:subtilisin family serine protease
MRKLALGLIDSGIAGPLLESVAASRCFLAAADGDVNQAVATDDQLGHGTALAGILLQGAPDASMLNAQVFCRSLSCSAAQVAAALEWLCEQGAQLVNMSFGLREDRPSLRMACERALEQGVILVAAAPARGEPVFPAAYAGVIGATGDARCAPGELSFLGTRQADFGGHVRAGASTVAGASVGCAHVAARAAGFLGANPGSSAAQLRAWLAEQSSYRGPERRVC